MYYSFNSLLFAKENSFSIVFYQKERTKNRELWFQVRKIKPLQTQEKPLCYTFLPG